MPSGGHARSGPAKVEGSRNSERIGFSYSALPPEGYSGEAPEYPLPPRFDRLVVDGVDIGARIQARELELWGQVWTTPQATAWADEPWRWNTIAMYVRTFVLCESSEAKAADKGSLHRLMDDIGLSAAGLKLNGWKIAKPQPVEAVAPVASVTSIKGRLNRGSA